MWRVVARTKLDDICEVVSIISSIWFIPNRSESSVLFWEMEIGAKAGNIPCWFSSFPLLCLELEIRVPWLNNIFLL